MALAALVVFGWLATAFAGGGPENLLLVVNPRSLSSLTIANHYVQLRQIPPGNLVFVPWDPSREQTDVNTFRNLVLLPVLKAIAQRHIDRQIDYVVYSSDFPWGIGLNQDSEKFQAAMRQAAQKNGGNEAASPQIQWPKQLTLTGSLTGLTYLWQPVLSGNSGYFDLRANRYMRTATVSPSEATIGFRASRQYGPRGEVVATGGRQYFLSTMLGVTAGRGNTVAEVLSYLRRSAGADGTKPPGTIYFVQNGDVRSKVRHFGFPAAARALNGLGVRAAILDGTVPLERNDVQGVMMGVAEFDWKASGSTILPGAICEHFTSYGGLMRKNAGQTPLSEFLRYGAAGASGTVDEPYSIAEKFPSPMLQVHYARGCTLAEAFYQSVHGPYQLLIVGDPLCRPWATIPKVTVAGVKPGDVVCGRLELKPNIVLAKTASGTSSPAEAPRDAVDHFELFIDGVRRTECKPGETLQFNTVDFADGYHELRVVAIGPPPIESQGRQIIPVRLANHDRKPITVRLTNPSPRANKPIVLAVSSPDSVGVVVFCAGQAVGRVASQEGEVTIPANTTGTGPVRINAVGLGPGGPQTNVLAEPLDFTVE